jgi:hypothetical protein
VELIWETLPDSKKYNHQLKRLEREFVNWDCAKEGFEGVRAQDILPLLVERFDFEKFMAFGNRQPAFCIRPAADHTAAGGRAAHDSPAAAAKEMAAVPECPEAAVRECPPDDQGCALREQLRLLRELLDDAVDARRQAERRVEELLASSSWLVTAPLRRLKTLVNRLR